jgi:hypothetical protein
MRVLCERLGRSRGHEIRLLPVDDFTGEPSGLLMITAEADYVCFPSRATPLHQAHIVLHEIAHLLLGHASPDGRENLGRLLAPGADPRLIRLMLSRQGYSATEERSAELMASLLLERSCRNAVAAHGRHQEPPGSHPPAGHGCSRGPHAGRSRSPGGAAGTGSVAWVTLPELDVLLSPAWCRAAYHQLSPLWSALREAVPQVAFPLPPSVQSQIGLRLYRRVVEIRDAELSLGPYMPPVAGQQGPCPDLATQAAALRAAIGARRRDPARCRAPLHGVPSPGTRPDLYGEVTRLVQVSRAFSGLPG